MEYICKQPGRIDYYNYETYIRSIQDKLPPHIYAFASNPDHFNLESHSSLHDAWLENLAVSEAAIGERNKIRQVEVKLTLLGPFHDRRIYLHYTGVVHYSFNKPPAHGNPRCGHGDLFTHEIRMGQSGLFIHELMFEDDANFLIECADIRHSEEPIPKTLE